MRRSPCRAQSDAQHTTSSRPEPVVRRLAVDQIANPWERLVVGDPRTVAATLLAGDEQQGKARLTSGAEPLGGGHLRREDALRVARAAPEDQTALFAAGEERR